MDVEIRFNSDRLSGGAFVRPTNGRGLFDDFGITASERDGVVKFGVVISEKFLKSNDNSPGPAGLHCVKPSAATTKRLLLQMLDLRIVRGEK